MAEFVELEIPAKPEFVSLARLVVSSFAAGCVGLEDDRTDDLRIAVSEACTNAIEAQSPQHDERVVVRCAETDGSLQVWIEDRGPGFDPGRLPDHPPVTDPARLNYERGLGIPLIRSLVDSVDFVSSDAGTRVCIVMGGPDTRSRAC